MSNFKASEQGLKRNILEYIALNIIAVLSWLTKLSAIAALPALVIYGVISEESLGLVFVGLMGSWMLLYLFNRGLRFLEYLIDSEKRVVIKR